MNPPGRVSRLLALLAGAASLCAQLVIAATGSGGAPPITVSFQAFWSAAQDRPLAPAAPDLPAAAVGLLAAGRGPGGRRARRWWQWHTKLHGHLGRNAATHGNPGRLRPFPS